MGENLPGEYQNLVYMNHVNTCTYRVCTIVGLCECTNYFINQKNMSNKNKNNFKKLHAKYKWQLQ